MKPPSSYRRIAATLVAALAAVSQVSCRDAPTAPESARRAAVAGAINVPGDSGAPEVIFLAPL